MVDSSQVASRYLLEGGTVPAFDDLVISAGENAPRVDGGEYDAVCIACRKERRFNRDLLAFKFRIVSQGQFFGVVLPGYCNLDFGRGRSRQIPARSKIGRWLRVINRFDSAVSVRRFHLPVFSCYQFIVEVGTTERDHLQRPIEEGEQYATVRDILAVVGRLGGKQI